MQIQFPDAKVIVERSVYKDGIKTCTIILGKIFINKYTSFIYRSVSYNLQNIICYTLYMSNRENNKKCYGRIKYVYSHKDQT